MGIIMQRAFCCLAIIIATICSTVSHGGDSLFQGEPIIHDRDLVKKTVQLDREDILALLANDSAIKSSLESLYHINVKLEEQTKGLKSSPEFYVSRDVSVKFLEEDSKNHTTNAVVLSADGCLPTVTVDAQVMACVISALDKAKQAGETSIVFGPIDAAKFGRSNKEVSKLIIEAVTAWLPANGFINSRRENQQSTPFTIVFCNSDYQNISHLKLAYVKKMMERPLSVHHAWKWDSGEGNIFFTPQMNMEIELAYQFGPGGGFEFANGRENYWVDFFASTQINKKGKTIRRLERDAGALHTVPEEIRTKFFHSLSSYTGKKVSEKYNLALTGKEDEVNRAVDYMKKLLNERKFQNFQWKLERALTSIEQTKLYALAHVLDVHFVCNFTQMTLFGLPEKVNLLLDELRNIQE